MKSNKWKKATPLTKNGLMFCEHCTTWKPQNDFRSYVGKTGKIRFYKARMCKSCCYAQDIAKVNVDPLLFFSRIISGLQRRSQKLGLLCDIDPDYLLSLYSKQNGKCFYTDASLACEKQLYKNRKHSLSIDKVVPENGYIRGNVVLTTNRINTIKCDVSLSEMQVWMPSWHERIIHCEWLQPTGQPSLSLS